MEKIIIPEKVLFSRICSGNLENFKTLKKIFLAVNTTATTTTTSTTTETTSTVSNCPKLYPVGVSTRIIPDEQMTATGTRVDTPGSSYTGASEARLNNKPSSKGVGAWEPTDVENSLIIEFNEVEDLKEIRTQGSPKENKYTLRYQLQYKKDLKEDWEVIYVLTLSD